MAGTSGCASASASQTVAKCISIAGHDRAVDPAGDAATRWAEQLSAWEIPAEIVAQAPESPWTCLPADFAVGSVGPVSTASSPFEREVLPPDGSVLDVGCGGGRASLALVPPAARIIGVDQSADMLRELERSAARPRRDRGDPPGSVARGRGHHAPRRPRRLPPRRLQRARHRAVPRRADRARRAGGRGRADVGAPAVRLERGLATVLGPRPAVRTDRRRPGGGGARAGLAAGGLALPAATGRGAVRGPGPGRRLDAAPALPAAGARRRGRGLPPSPPAGMAR